MNIFLLISYLDKAGGSEETLTTLAIELKKRGHRVSVFNRCPADRDNQYLRRLRQARVSVVTLPAFLVNLVGDWNFQEHLVLSLVKASRPFLLVPALFLTLLRRQSIRQNWEGVVGRWRAILGAMLYHDRRDAFFMALVTAFATWQHPDIVHVLRAEMTPAVVWAERKGLTCVYSEHCVPGELTSNQVWERRSADLNRATIVTAVCKATTNGLRQAARINRPIVIIPPVLSEAPQTLSLAPARSGSLTITCIARLSPEKGLDYLLLAARDIIAKHASVKVLIAGGGELETSLWQQATSLGIADSVHFCGYFPKSDLPKIMAMTDILVLPSLSEAMGFVIVEAMAYGKPVVATAVGGTSEIVDDGTTGLLVPPKNPRELAEALLKLVEDEPLRVEMGEAGRAKFLSGSFSVEAFVQAYLDVYQQALTLNANRQASIAVA